MTDPKSRDASPAIRRKGCSFGAVNEQSESRMKGRSISQQRIARDLGVSQALVSLVLNGKRENISEDSYERIWKYAVKRGYRPKGMQANGNGLAANHVGFILRSGLRLYTQSNFFSHIQHGLHTALQERGYNSVFLGAEDTLSRQSLKEELQQRNLFGLVIMGQVDEAFVRSLKAVQRNVVAVSATYSGSVPFGHAQRAAGAGSAGGDT